MNETAQQQRGGKAHHSVLEPHFEFIREQRRQRKTWKEIADSLFSKKSIRVTLYAAYHFYRRKLKRGETGMIYEDFKTTKGQHAVMVCIGAISESEVLTEDWIKDRMWELGWIPSPDKK